MFVCVCAPISGTREKEVDGSTLRHENTVQKGANQDLRRRPYQARQRKGPPPPPLIHAREAFQTHRSQINRRKLFGFFTLLVRSATIHFPRGNIWRLVSSSSNVSHSLEYSPQRRRAAIEAIAAACQGVSTTMEPQASPPPSGTPRNLRGLF